MNIKSNKGAALLTTLMIGILALVIILALFAFILFGKSSSVLKERYTTALEAARGTAYYIIDKLNLGATDIICYSSTNNSINCTCSDVIWDDDLNITKCANDNTNTTIDRIYLDGYSKLPAANGGNYDLKATLIFKDLSDDGIFDIYLIEVNATKEGTRETAIIDFIYKAPRREY
ncbi:MAG: hypothetical protein DSY66_03115 [Persephonella sp.]|nr:MAG: hypothetical protein DSY66_03115 [Persephonella sp.]